MTARHTAMIVGLAAITGAANAQINGVVIRERVFNDFPDSNLVTTNNFDTDFTFYEDNFGSGGWANRHSAFFSADGGATGLDFDYNDGFDFSLTVDLDATPASGREAGFHADLFGTGFFGVLPNGEIAAFGSILPFWTAGGGVWTPGVPAQLRMIHTPGDGDGTSGNYTIASTMEYMYNIGGGWVTSGPVNFTTTEGGVPSNFDFLVGFGVQNTGGNGGSSNAYFSNFVIPAPSVGALLGIAALGAARRRR